MQTEIFDNAADFMAAVQGKKPRKPARDARPDLPRGPAGEGDRVAQLMRIARFGFSLRFDSGGGFCFWQPSTGARTTVHATYAGACIAAEQELGSC